MYTKKVLLVSTSERCGGGAIAARRLMDALRKQGVQAAMMVRDKQTSDGHVHRVGNLMPKFLERLAVLPRCGMNRKRMWQADVANVGIDITRTRQFREADVIHLHWVNQGMLSLGCLQRIMQSGKRIVWTLHDEWPYLGVCHYRAGCRQAECRQCPVLSGSLPNIIYARKRAMYREAAGRLTFVGCSRWIVSQAQHALPEADVRHVNNCIPFSLFRPSDMAAARRRLGLPQEKKVLLFCSQKVTDERKGIRFLCEALHRLRGENIHLVIVGQNAERIPLPDGIPVTRAGSVGEEQMASLYAAADVFVTPSLQDNLPNTIAEAMSCGTPCVGFCVGGIPEMIDHRLNGYVACYKDSADLAEGIRYVLTRNLRPAARQKAEAAYSEEQVAREYMKVYDTPQETQNKNHESRTAPHEL